jgi:DNA-binding Xre family transcriptional regulator
MFLVFKFKRPENEGGGAVVRISIIERICEALGT